MLYRSLTTGLLAACVILLARRTEPVFVRPVPGPRLQAPLPPLPATDALTIVDVAPNLRGKLLASLVRLAPGERVLDVNDHPVRDELEAGAAIAWPAVSYVDVSIGGGPLPRRVLLLLHQ